MKTRSRRLRLAGRGIAAAAAIVAAVFSFSTACARSATDSSPASQAWTAENTVTPERFATELAAATGNDKPVVVYTGPAFLYKAGHIPGAVARGPASSPEGLAELTSWAQDLPRSTNLVVYCGCCPLNDCPNLQPSYATLRALGFARLRVLMLPTNFGSDWARKGFPVER